MNFDTRLARVVVALLFATVASVAEAQQQPNPESPRYKGFVALQEFLESEGDEAASDFIENRIAADVREKLGDDTLRQTLTAMRDEVRGSSGQGVQPISELAVSIRMTSADGESMTVTFELSRDDTDRFLAIRTPSHTIE